MRGGVDARISKQFDRKTEKWHGGHKLQAVFGEMLCQIAMDFAGLPDARTMTWSQVRYFYERLRPTIKARTLPRKTK